MRGKRIDAAAHVGTVRTYLDSQKVLPKLSTPEEASAYTGVKVERLIELSRAEIAPCVFIDGNGPFFIKHDITAWVKAHLILMQSGKALTKPYCVQSPERPATVPHEIAPLEGRLYECNPSLFSCVYFLIKDNRVVYVGQSVNIAGRLVDHFRTKEFDRVLYLLVPESELDRTEGAFIRFLKPPLNGKGAPISIFPERILHDYGYPQDVVVQQ